MNCDRYDELSDLVLSGELRPQEQAAVDQHLAGCEDCRRRHALARRIQAAVRKVAGQPVAPEGFAAAISTRIAVRRRRRWPRVAAAAALLLAIGIGAWLTGTAVAHRTASRELVAAHLRYVGEGQPPCEIVTADPRALAAWGGQQLGRPVELELASLDWRILGARRATVQRKPGMLVFYDDGGMRISLFAIAADQLDLRGMTAVNVRGRRCWSQHHKGYHVKVWRLGKLYYASVSDDLGSGIAWR